MQATLADALTLTKLLFRVFERQYFVALTGGLVYKDGARKDIDLIIYRNRTSMPFETIDLVSRLERVGITEIKSFGFVTKCKWSGFDVDILHPETTTYGEYNDRPEESVINVNPPPPIQPW